MRSIRARTLFLVLGVLTLSLSLISYKSYRDAQHEIEELFDAQLAQTARLLAGLVGREMLERERGEVQAMLDEALALQTLPGGHGALSLGHRYEGKLAFQVFDEQGRLLLHSASWRARSPSAACCRTCSACRCWRCWSGWRSAAGYVRSSGWSG